MLKKLTKLTLLIVVLFGLTACFGGDVSEHELVGTWGWEGDQNWRYVFNPDGTGTRGDTSFTEGFRWSIPGDGRLRIDRNSAPRDERRREEWNYTIANNRLTIESRQEAGLSFSYLKIEE